MLVFAIAKGNILMGGVVLILPALGDVQIIEDFIVSLGRLASSAVDLPAVPFSSVDLLVSQTLVALEGTSSQYVLYRVYVQGNLRGKATWVNLAIRHTVRSVISWKGLSVLVPVRSVARSFAPSANVSILVISTYQQERPMR